MVLIVRPRRRRRVVAWILVIRVWVRCSGGEDDAIRWRKRRRRRWWRRRRRRCWKGVAPPLLSAASTVASGAAADVAHMRRMIRKGEIFMDQIEESLCFDGWIGG